MIDGVPTWFVRASLDELSDADEAYCSIEGELESGEPIDVSLLPELEAVHARVEALEAGRTLLTGRRELEEAKRAQAALFARMGVSTYDEVALRVAMGQRANAALSKLPGAVQRRVDAEEALSSVAEVAAERTHRPNI